jgi:lysophospholipase L1-like esterase
MEKMSRLVLGNLLAVVPLLALAGQDVSAAQNKRDLMAAMGDSMSAASLAGTYLQPVPQDRPRDGLGGDGQLYENRSSFSWTTGLNIRSHYVRLRDIYRRNGEELAVFNIAEPGAMSEKLLAQADWIRKKMKDGYRRLAYVTLLIGGNDSCSGKTPEGIPNEEIRENILKALAKLSEIKQDRPIRVLMVSLPKIPDLKLPAIANRETFLGLHCLDLFKSPAFYCKNLAKWRTPAEYRREVGVMERKWQTLRDVASEARTRFPNLDIAFASSFEKLSITGDHLASDCFHPNAKAQDMMSEAFWAEQPWYR